MSSKQNSPIECVHCKKRFQTVSSRNRHLREIHKDASFKSRKESRIKCPSCPQSSRVYFATFDVLNKHINDLHNIEIKTDEHEFRCKEEFKKWKEYTEKEARSFYCLNSKTKSTTGTVFYYECHRSNLGKFESKHKVRAPKLSGSIKIHGVCPSRIRAEIHDSGRVSVTYTTPHVGHQAELRCQVLSSSEKSWIINEIKNGVSYENIVKKARHMEKDECSRLSLLTKKDIRYWAKTNNVNNKLPKSDMVAVEMKVSEWNNDHMNTVFLFKKPGETHHTLDDNDFALAIMNPEMEYMLKKYGKRIICMDGTHGTNTYNYELTTVLVLDEQHIGYPVVFLISSRKDTLIQEVLLTELKNIIGTLIPDYFMTDDSPIYWNAWNNVMGKLPKRLLCAWHVKKNWVIQSKSKIVDRDICKKVRHDLDELLKETEESEYIKLKEQLFRYLQESGQNVFLQYLKKFYFQDISREASWAYCFRKRAGINTTMDLEAFHGTLKDKSFCGKAIRSLETCLDKLDEFLKDKSWKRMASISRPIATHDHIVNKTHRLAMTMDFDAVSEQSKNLFRVHSQSEIDFYQVEILENDCNCRTMKCRICDTCAHKLKCSCYEATINNNFCKHMHLIIMYLKNKGTRNTPETDPNDVTDLLPSTSQEVLSEEVNLRILSNCDKKDLDIYHQQKREHCKNLLNSVLDQCKSAGDYDHVAKKLKELKDHFQTSTVSSVASASRKTKKQTFFPCSKKMKL